MIYVSELYHFEFHCVSLNGLTPKIFSIFKAVIVSFVILLSVFLTILILLTVIGLYVFHCLYVTPCLLLQYHKFTNEVMSLFLY